GHAALGLFYNTVSDEDLTAANAGDTAELSGEDRALLLRLARQALEDYLDRGEL
ncbi:MAG: hypothetical protein GWN99_14605, partial [Gemmatimonadetes bacterium]|nr:hypothetical protein [Gemmatimonadota bacterium]NIS02276.1 hypothetical protein [Gemmatimonadota bacterium]NIT68095.1 hypothetical protein [Gemmatimonadota bacterium]NIV24722.1 hypothetical protein [Gemmatimonadota bacterium]NIW76673.1 hypothetical protein [Gemmatimonadota bacterium]